VNEVPEVLARLLFEYDGAPSRRTLLRIARANPEVAEYLAAQPDAAHDLLLQLSEFTPPEIIARSPNAPVWLLTKVGRFAPEALLENPVLLLLSLESPDKFQEMLGSLVEEILKLPDPPPALFRPEFLKSTQSRELALAHPKIPPETLLELAGSKDYYTRGLAAQHPLLPEIFKRILNLPELQYAYTTEPKIQNPGLFPVLTEAEQEALLRGPTWFQYLLSTLPALPERLMTRLAESNVPAVQQNIASNKQAPAKILLELSYSSDANIQSAIASNPNTPPEVLARYASQALMVFALASNPSLPLSIGLQLLAQATKASGEVCYVSEILRHPDLPEEMLRDSVNDKRKEWRAAAAKNPKLPEEKLLTLVADKSQEVRMGVASRKDLSEKIMEKLSQDKAAKVRATLAINPSISLAMMTKLVEDPKIPVRVALARNHNLNRVIMSQLKKDESDLVRNELFKTHAKFLRK
jgi:hypothetical protein